MRLISYTDQYEMSGRRGSQIRTVAPRDHMSVGRGRPPSEIQLCLGTSKHRGTDHMALFEGLAFGLDRYTSPQSPSATLLKRVASLP